MGMYAAAEIYGRGFSPSAFDVVAIGLGGAIRVLRFASY